MITRRNFPTFDREFKAKLAVDLVNTYVIRYQMVMNDRRSDCHNNRIDVELTIVVFKSLFIQRIHTCVYTIDR